MKLFSTDLTLAENILKHAWDSGLQIELLKEETMFDNRLLKIAEINLV